MLDANERTQAWWFSARADCDDLVATWTASPGPLTPHLQSCSECRADLADAAVVDSPPRRHLSSDELWRFDMGLLAADERARMEAHAAKCADCAHAILALEEGDVAIEEAMELEEEGMTGVPRARTSREPAQRRPGARHPEQREVLEERRDFRVLLVRERQRVKLLVQPLSGRSVTAAVFLSPGKPSLKPTQGPEGISFELGAEAGGSRSAHLTVQSDGETLERDFSF